MWCGVVSAHSPIGVQQTQHPQQLQRGLTEAAHAMLIPGWKCHPGQVLPHNPPKRICCGAQKRSLELSKTLPCCRAVGQPSLSAGCLYNNCNHWKASLCRLLQTIPNSSKTQLNHFYLFIFLLFLISVTPSTATESFPKPFFPMHTTHMAESISK